MEQQQLIDDLLAENAALREQIKTNSIRIHGISHEICQEMCGLTPGMVVTHPDFAPTGAKVLGVHPRGPYAGDTRVGFHIEIIENVNGEAKKRVLAYYEPQNFTVVSV